MRFSFPTYLHWIVNSQKIDVLEVDYCLCDTPILQILKNEQEKEESEKAANAENAEVDEARKKEEEEKRKEEERKRKEEEERKKEEEEVSELFGSGLHCGLAFAL